MASRRIKPANYPSKIIIVLIIANWLTTLVIAAGVLRNSGNNLLDRSGCPQVKPQRLRPQALGFNQRITTVASTGNSPASRWTIFFPNELQAIMAAADRNGCGGDDLVILLAIRKAENGRAGREFGVLHPAAIDTDLDTQAGWAAATIVKNRSRWQDAGRPGDFIEFLGSRYCPADAHPLNRHWVKNVRFWCEKLQEGGRQ